MILQKNNFVVILDLLWFFSVHFLSANGGPAAVVETDNKGLIFFVLFVSNEDRFLFFLSNLGVGENRLWRLSLHIGAMKVFFMSFFFCT
jgi:hypothetical protein